MTSPTNHHRRHHHSRPAKIHSPSHTGSDKRRKLMNQHGPFFGGGGDQFPPHPNHGAAYPHNQGYYMFVPEGSEGGGGNPEDAAESAGPPPPPPQMQLPPPYGYGYAPSIHPQPHPHPGGGHNYHQHHPTNDHYYNMSRMGSAAGGGGGIVPPPTEGYYHGPPPPPHYGAPPTPHQLSRENIGLNKIYHHPGDQSNIPPSAMSPHQYSSRGVGGDYEHSSSTSTSPQKKLHPLPSMIAGAETSPGAGDDNNESETTPACATVNEDTLDTRSPEGSRNLNPLEERVQGIVDNHSEEQRQQKEQQISQTTSDASPTSPYPSKGEQIPHVAHYPASASFSNNMGRLPPYHGMHPPPMPPHGMAPYHGPPPSHQGMHHPAHHPYLQNRQNYHPYMPPTIAPQHSPRHNVVGYPSPTHQHHSQPSQHRAAPHPPPPSHHVPGMPQFLPQFQNMSQQHHRNAASSGSGVNKHVLMSPGGGGNRMVMMPPPPHSPAMLGGPMPPPPSARAVNSSNGETMWTCEYCNLKFNTWEDCAAHEEADCPAAAYHHQNSQRSHLQGSYGPPGPGQYHPMNAKHDGMIHPGHDNVASSTENIQSYGDVGRNPHNRALKGRKMSLSAFPNNGHLFVDHDAEYAVNTDRVTYLFSTASDVDSLSDRQCYVRTHFVEIFIANAADVGARHSRGAQMLNLGQIGLRCAYCVKLKQRDRAERAICYPSSISRIYQTVADMQRFHFESCVAIPPKVLEAYRSLKTTRPRGVGSPQSYWDKSAREIGLVDSKNGIQVSEGDVKFEMQRKSVVTGMLAILDGPSDASRDTMIMQDMLARQEDTDEEEGKDRQKASMYREHRDPQAMKGSESTSSSIIQAAVVSSPGSDTGSKAEDEDVNLGVIPSTPKSAKDVEAEEDANILLMLKKTPESPPRVDRLESRSSSVEYAHSGKNENDEIANPTDATNNVDGLVAEV